MTRVLYLGWGTIIFALVCVVILVSKASAESYDVTATIHFPAPTNQAVINNVINGTKVNNATLLVSGTCEALAPNGTVSIWRNGIAIGSAPCDGTFSITVSLLEGANTLIARSASVSGLYGPDSAPVTVILELPKPLPTPISTSTPTPTPANPGTVNEVSQNFGAASNLTATPAQAFSTLDTSELITLIVKVVGGSTPYTIYINWGDGSEETRTVDQPGSYQFSHKYAKDGAYTVKGVVRDVLGATTTFDYAVVSQKPTANTNNQAADLALVGSDKQRSSRLSIWWPLIYIIIGASIAFLGYRLGVMRTRRKNKKNNSLQKAPITLRPAKRKKQK